ncbi:MAG: RIP metalloprotease RseP [Akkermansia sp.]|nr:RIP metalloprotease RseP [Akkermansia sp.]
MSTILSTLETAWLIFLVVMFFNVMIFVHELGHFLAGKWRGAYIDRFQIWFGKPIWQKKIGGVQWGIGWIPAGGFVSLPQLADMQGIEGEADIPKDLKPLKPLDKVIIAAAGPLASLALAYFFAILVFFVGKPVAEMSTTTIGYIPENSPAAQAGLQPGDIIRSVDGQEVHKWAGNMEGVRELVAMSEHEKITFTIERPQADGSTQLLTIESGYKLPETKWWQRTAMRQVGIMPAAPAIVGGVFPDSPAAQAGLVKGQRIVKVNGAAVYSPATVLEAADKGTVELTLQNPDGSEVTASVTPTLPANWQGLEGAAPIMGIQWGGLESVQKTEHPGVQEQINQSFRWMGETLAKVAAPGSSVGMEHLSGPVGIGNYLYQMLDSPEGWKLILWFAVVLNVNLAVLNILPLPIVDGGHVVLGTLEIIFRRPVGGKLLEWIQTGFIFLLLTFFIFVTFKDVGDLVGGNKEKADKLPAPVFSK